MAKLLIRLNSQTVRWLLRIVKQPVHPVEVEGLLCLSIYSLYGVRIGIAYLKS